MVVTTLKVNNLKKMQNGRAIWSKKAIRCYDLLTKKSSMTPKKFSVKFQAN